MTSNAGQWCSDRPVGLRSKYQRVLKMPNTGWSRGQEDMRIQESNTVLHRQNPY